MLRPSDLKKLLVAGNCDLLNRPHMGLSFAATSIKHALHDLQHETSLRTSIVAAPVRTLVTRI